MLRIGVLSTKNGGRRPPMTFLFKGRWSKRLACCPSSGEPCADSPAERSTAAAASKARRPTGFLSRRRWGSLPAHGLMHPGHATGGNRSYHRLDVEARPEAR